MNILFIGHSYFATGAERVLATIINIHTDETIGKYIVFPMGKKDDFSPLCDLENVKGIIRLPYKNVNISAGITFGCLCYNIVALLFMCCYIPIKKIDKVYINTSANLLGIVISLFFHKKVLWHIHEQSNTNTRVIPKLLKSLYRKVFAAKNVTLIFTSCRAMKSWARELAIDYDTKVPVILNPPIRDISIIPFKKKVFSIGYLGTLVKSKNVLSLVEAFASIVWQTSNSLQLILGGDGPLRNEIIRKCAELKISDRVILLGFIQNPDNFYSQIDVLVQPSYNESWSMVVAEALSVGIPVIVSKESGIADLLQDRECLKIDPCDLSDIRDKLVKMLNGDVYADLQKKSISAYERLAFNQQFTEVINALVYGS